MSKEFAFSKDDILQLYQMLASKRPAKSTTEARFIQHYLGPLGVERDAYGNLYKRIGDLPVSWSCHTDTVHDTDGYQSIVLKDKHIIKLHKEEKSNCLGADDTLGVWLMVQMIQRQRPGLYVFHREEERGGKGSRWASRNNKSLYKDIECMIALDRRGADSVITRQAGGRCCSDEFGNSLAGKLNAEGLKFALDTGGTFTDSASYTDIIGECTNLSVGYYAQHWKNEYVDLNILLAIHRALVTVDFSGLTIKRKPGEREKYVARTGWAKGYGSGYGGYEGGYEGWGAETATATRDAGYWENGKWIQGKRPAVALPAPKKPYREVYYRMTNGKKVPDTILALVQDYPLQVATMLEEWGFTVPFIRDEITDRLGPKRAVRGGSTYEQVNDNRTSEEGTPS